MRFLKLAVTLLAAALLAACSGAPSDGDIRNLIVEQLKKEGAGLAMMGIDLGEVVEVAQVKVLNKAEDGKNAYVADVENTLKFKKNLNDFKGMEKQMALGMLFGEFKAGQETPASKTRLRMVKGDKGWMLSDK